jgi:hypothetical protein
LKRGQRLARFVGATELSEGNAESELKIVVLSNWGSVPIDGNRDRDRPESWMSRDLQPFCDGEGDLPKLPQEI